MMEYIVLDYDSSSELEYEVNKCLKEGWLLQGGVSIAQCEVENSREGYREINMTFAQAMTRDTKEPTK